MLLAGVDLRNGIHPPAFRGAAPSEALEYDWKGGFMADNNNNVFGIDPKSKVVETRELSIRGHLLRWSDTVIQISNISMVSTAEVPAPRFGGLLFLAVLSGISGICLLAINSRLYYPDESIQAIGIAGIVASVLLALIWGSTTGNKRDKVYLNLALNSGNVYSFLFTDKEFMRQVLQVFANIFESGTTSETNININTQVGEIRENGVAVQFNVGK